MKNKKINMLSVTLWIVIVAIIIGLIQFIASGFNLFAGMLILVEIATFLPVFMFGSTTFLLGFGQTSNLSISILLLVIFGIATYFVSPLITLSADPKWLYGIIKLLLLFSITLGAGYLARYLPMMGQIATGATTGLLLFYIALAGLSVFAHASADSDNHIGLYLFEDGAISADLRFCFIYDPSSHSESKKQSDAKRLWDEMIEIVNGYR